MKETRIIGKKVEINEEETKQYFINRTEKELPHRYNYVLNQDSNPELALERDRYEKNKMGKILNFIPDMKVLDIGCGVGRWADEIVKYIAVPDSKGKYIGVDYNEKILQMARENRKESENCYFYEGDFQRILSVLEEKQEEAKVFDKILINGVLQYINDKDIDLCMDNVAKLVANRGMIYIKEAVGRDCRFTLRDYASDELECNYNSIYRSLYEYTGLFTNHFLKNGYAILSCGTTWEDDLENRKETMSFYWIFQK